MKFRHDFVTNSSSSSFIVNKHDLTAEQVDALRDVYTTAHKFKDQFVVLTKEAFGEWVDQGRPPRPDGKIVCPWWVCDDPVDPVESYLNEAGAWSYEELDANTINLSTSMDNFDIEDIFKLLKLPRDSYYEDSFYD